MIKLGKTNTLTVVKKVDFGMYLDGGREIGQILLPTRYVPEGLKIGQEIEVFLYLDQDEKIIATTEMPLAQVGDFAFLEVAWVNNFGAFLHWGPMKDLFVPFREQKMKMTKGHSYIVHVHLDEDSYRIMASAKVDRYIDTTYPPYHVGDEVEVLVWQKTELGLKVIVNNRYGGLLYDDQVFRNLRTGDKTKAYISQIRPDGKLDLMLSRKGQAAVEDFSDTLLQYIKDNGGHTVLGDKSPAEDIYDTFGVSKKVFKKAVGDLYKKRLITIDTDGLHAI
ncbi:MAG: S1-like domain-containing RNA-binding protein [Bacteroidaceae bacterium]|nr:S1-like domain-containing RNA-binding protein [Bacteroidaceae bacterium]